MIDAVRNTQSAMRWISVRACGLAIWRCAMYSLEEPLESAVVDSRRRGGMGSVRSEWLDFGRADALGLACHAASHAAGSAETVSVRHVEVEERVSISSDEPFRLAGRCSGPACCNWNGHPGCACSVSAQLCPALTQSWRRCSTADGGPEHCRCGWRRRCGCCSGSRGHSCHRDGDQRGDARGQGGSRGGGGG